ncbi:hypothetical protein [Acinetobacter phage vB_AbaM_fThrA]|nr:hypothetical protein [Acinetobacter phage vB_AbaM_fThrA]
MGNLKNHIILCCSISKATIRTLPIKIDCY